MDADRARLSEGVEKEVPDAAGAPGEDDAAAATAVDTAGDDEA